jgi:hypothetical protein
MHGNMIVKSAENLFAFQEILWSMELFSCYFLVIYLVC